MHRFLFLLIPLVMTTDISVNNNNRELPESIIQPASETFNPVQGMLTFFKKRNAELNPVVITFETLMQEMTDLDRVARFPDTEYLSLQASSYNRASVAPDKPGWFADGDGISWIREEFNGGKKEYVIMEHDGPGCITRMWTPFFYYNFNNRIGPNVRIYLDESKEPVIEENFIALLTGKGSFHRPFANYTAHAGVCFLPIPFSKSCKITLDDKAFYNIINYRAYRKGTNVQTFSNDQYLKASSLLATTAETLVNPKPYTGGWLKLLEQIIKPGDSLLITLPEGNHAIQQLTIRIDPNSGLQSLRSTILKMNFDGKQTVWCPVGDFFCSPDTINLFTTRNLLACSMVTYWYGMPDAKSNHGPRLDMAEKKPFLALLETLRNHLVKSFERSKVVFDNNLWLHSPCISETYRGIWPDDFLYPLLVEPDLYEREKLTQIAGFMTNSIVDLECFPDRVEADGMPVMQPGSLSSPHARHMPLHLPAAWVRVIDNFEKWDATIPREED